MNDGNGVPRRGRTRSGFTLIELMVVIAIVLLLLAVVAPSISKALSVAKTALCGSNLSQLAKAHAAFRSDKTITQAMIPGSWQGTLKPYLDDNEDVMVCPEYAGDLEQANTQSITELVYFRVDHGGRSDYVELDENPYMLKLSDGQFHQAKSQGLLGNGSSSNNFPRGSWPYADDGSGVYWLCMEDYGGDWDYKDVMTKITDNHDGTVTVGMIAGFTGHRNYLCSKTNEFGDIRIGSNTTVAIEVILDVGSSTASYGINGRVEDIRYNGAKLLIIDYNWVVAAPTADWDLQTVPPSRVPDFARHLGKLNMLLNGGSVMLMRPEEIDPGDQLVRESLWLNY